MFIKIKGDVVKLYGRIWEGDGAYIADKLEELEGSDELTIRLHTIGGSVHDGNLIRNAIADLERPTHIIVDGLAASMGAIILTAADKLSIRRNAQIMIHEPRGFLSGVANDFNNMANTLNETRKNFIDELVAITNLPEMQVKKWMNGDNWFSAKQALKNNLVHEILDPIFKDDQMQAFNQFKMTAYLELPKELESTFNLEDAECRTPQAANDTQQTIPNNSDANANKNKEKEMKQALIEAFKLQGVTAESSDTVVLEAMRTVVTGLKNKVTDKETELTALQDKEKANMEASINSAVSAAITAGKISEAQKETYVSIGKTSGLQALSNVFENMQGRQSLHGKVTTPSGGSVAGIPEARKEWTWDKWQTEDPRGLEALAESNKEAFEALGKRKYGESFTA
ncbi:MAG: ATP-dependent Clp protease proteolytic subunit [Bacteroidales bacterium]|nr:ATP-dependent Clp protease proteolytic subunit [Bacteroidales bacterium]